MSDPVRADIERADMRISVIIPAHNEELLLEATLRQLKEGIGQLGLSAEIIVVNDDSCDRTAEIASNCSARVIDVNLRNIGAVRNAGASNAEHKYLVFVDADTLVPVDTLQATIQALQKGVIGGGALVELIDDGQSIAWYKSWLFPTIAVVWLRWGGWAAGCYMFCTADAFAEMGGFPEEYFAAEEFFFSRRLKKSGKFVVLRQPVQTSARKLHDYSLWQLLRFIIWPFFNRQGLLKSRQGLELLYEDR